MRARPTVRVTTAVARRPWTHLALGVAVALLLACAPAAPRPLAYDGSESCEQCRMAVTDSRYGAQLVTRTGKSHAFDSIECLAEYWTQAARSGEPPRAWVNDFTQPGTLVPVDSARFLRVAGPRTSPMGLGLLAVGPSTDIAALQRELGAGASLDWKAVLALVAERASHEGHAAGEGQHVAR